MQLLSQTISNYLSNLPDDLQLTLATYLNAIRLIFEFHSATFYPKLLQCDAKVTIICDLFRTHIDAMKFAIYHTYAANVTEAQKLLQNYAIDNVRIGRFCWPLVCRWWLLFSNSCTLFSD